MRAPHAQGFVPIIVGRMYRLWSGRAGIQRASMATSLLMQVSSAVVSKG
jgi:hypothetical protein